MNTNTRILYHRGDGVAPENSLPAFEKASQGGGEGVELDVQLTSDDIPVVIHDLTVERTTDGTGRVENLSLAELQELKLKSEEYQDQSVPTLHSVLEVLRGVELINLELKFFSQDMETNYRWAGVVAEVVDDMEMKDSVLFSSYNHYCIKRIVDIDPGARTGLIYRAALYEPWRYASNLGVEALHPYHMSTNRDMVENCHNHGIKVIAYGADDQDDIRRLMQIGVDAIITESVNTALKEREKIGCS